MFNLSSHNFHFHCKSVFFFSIVSFLSPVSSAEIAENPSNLINLAKRELERDRELLMSKSLPGMPLETVESQDQQQQPGEDGSDSDSDTESDDKTNELQAEINDIQSDIEIKTKLIEQLELSQQRMMVMKQHYEEKLTVLSAKITNTQKERDQVLANMGGGGRKFQFSFAFRSNCHHHLPIFSFHFSSFIFVSQQHTKQLTSRQR